jgi:hypothetical protein
MLCESAFGLLAPAICMDLNDPGFPRFLEAQSPAIVCFATNWVEEEGFEVLPYWRERSDPGRASFVAADTWGGRRGVQFHGCSVILGANREVLAEAPARATPSSARPSSPPPEAGPRRRALSPPTRGEVPEAEGRHRTLGASTASKSSTRRPPARIICERVDPSPCPMLSSTRSRIGASPPCASWSRAANLKLWSGTTRSS